MKKIKEISSHPTSKQMQKDVISYPQEFLYSELQLSEIHMDKNSAVLGRRFSCFGQVIQLFWAG